GPALNGLSIVLMYTGRYGEAEAALSEALAVNKKWPISTNINVAASLNGFGILYQLTGQSKKAVASLRQAVAMNEKIVGADHPAVAGASLLLAKLLHETGRDQEALALLSHANVVAHLSGSQMIAWQVAGELMEVYSSGKFADTFKAIYYGKQAVNDLQRLRG